MRAGNAAAALHVIDRAGLLTCTGREGIHADIGEIVVGRRPGRETPDEITVFDSTGLAIQDVACAAHVYRRLTSDPETRDKLPTIDFLK